MFIYECVTPDIHLVRTLLLHFSAPEVRSHGRFAYASAELLSHFVASHFPTHTALLLLAPRNDSIRFPNSLDSPTRLLVPYRNTHSPHTFSFRPTFALRASFLCTARSLRVERKCNACSLAKTSPVNIKMELHFASSLAR
jgi:hypothetical protein